MRFANPFWLLLLAPLLFYFIVDLKQKRITSIRFSNVDLVRKIVRKSTKYTSKISRYLRFIILALIIITLARPQSVSVKEEISSKGIDIMMVLDTSASMAAEDFQPDNRLVVAKDTMKAFISKRKTDRIGLVVFGSDAYTLVPLSKDYKLIGNVFDDIELSMAGDGTAIGMAISTALNRLRDSESKSKIIILLTDGENNAGEIEPVRAADLAHDLGVKIYSIGIGKEEGAKIPYHHPVFGKLYHEQRTYIDEKTLTEISTITKGKFFRATDEESLTKIYNSIDKLETTEIKTTEYMQYYDFFPMLLKLILLLLCVELVLFNIFFVVVP